MNGTAGQVQATVTRSQNSGPTLILGLSCATSNVFPRIIRDGSKAYERFIVFAERVRPNEGRII
jgi:hypothetical protein